MENKIRDLIVRDIDLSSADGYAITREDIVSKALELDNILNEDLLFSGINGENLKRFLEHGTNFPNSNFIYANSDLVSKFSTSTEPETLDYVLEREIPMLAIYDANQFKDINLYRYEFKNPENRRDSLIGIYFLKE